MAITTNPNPIFSPIQSQIFVKLLNGKTLTLNLTGTEFPISTAAVKRHIHHHTKIPTQLQRLILGPRQLHDDDAGSIITTPQCTITLTLPLVGGKGGFGSLLRGAATKAGQKKTNNFDACRDMSGRRLRHVNAEKRLEEWKNGEEERKLEKVADEWLKKMAKKGKKEGGLSRDREAEKYVEKYREESARCVAEVEQSVREAVKAELGKRKKVAGEGGIGVDKKKLKIWMGKRKIGESDSDISDEDSSDDDNDSREENEKSIVLNNGNSSDSSKDAEGSSGSVAGGKHEGECPGSSSEEEKETVMQENLKPVANSGEEIVQNEENSKIGSVIYEDVIVNNTDVGIVGVAAVPGTVALETVNDYKETESVKLENIVDHRPSVLSSANGDAVENVPSDAKANCSAESKSICTGGTMLASGSTTELEKPLNFYEFNSAAELEEAFGMERLKSELQSRGLKCGGTLQERAARLFLLKSTPLEKLPKKLLAKK